MLETLPSRALLGPALYLGIVAFGITMLFKIGATNVAWASVFIYLPFLTLAMHVLTRADSYGGAAEIEHHLTDFPYERGLPAWRYASRSLPERPPVNASHG